MESERVYLIEIESGDKGSLRLRKVERGAKERFFQVQCLSAIEEPVLANTMSEARLQ